MEALYTATAYRKGSRDVIPARAAGSVKGGNSDCAARASRAAMYRERRCRRPSDVSGEVSGARQVMGTSHCCAISDNVHFTIWPPYHTGRYDVT